MNTLLDEQIAFEKTLYDYAKRNKDDPQLMSILEKYFAEQLHKIKKIKG